MVPRMRCWSSGDSSTPRGAVCNVRYRPSSAGLLRWDPSRRRQRVAETRLAVGAHAPDFTAPDQDGQVWHLAEALEQATQVLVFYRGDW